MTRTSFRSKLDKELYAIIKDEAYRMEIPVSDHISNIVSAYAEKKRRKEMKDAVMVTGGRGSVVSKSKP